MPSRYFSHSIKCFLHPPRLMPHTFLVVFARPNVTTFRGKNNAVQEKNVSIHAYSYTLRVVCCMMVSCTALLLIRNVAELHTMPWNIIFPLLKHGHDRIGEYGRHFPSPSNLSSFLLVRVAFLFLLQQRSGKKIIYLLLPFQTPPPKPSPPLGSENTSKHAPPAAPSPFSSPSSPEK